MDLELPLTDTARAAIRRRSKDLFGNKYFLEVCAAFARAEDGRGYARELSELTGIPDASLRSPLRRLTDAGCLRSLGISRGALPRVLERQASPLWLFAEELLDQVAGGDPSARAR